MKKRLQHIFKVLMLAVFVAAAAQFSYAAPIGLGQAGNYTVLAMDQSYVFMGNDPTTVNGNFGIGHNSFADLKKGTINGDLDYNGSNTSVSVGATVTGTTNSSANMAQAVSDARSASTAFAALSGTSIGDITSNTTLTGSGGDNVYSLSNLSLNSASLTLNGGASDFFIFNLTGDFDFASSNVILGGGVQTNHVIFNVTGSDTGDPLTLKNSGTFRGTLLAPDRAIHGDHLTVYGALIGGYDPSFDELNKDGAGLSLHSEIIVNGDPYAVPLPASVILFASGLAGLVGVPRIRKLRSLITLTRL